jgi:hypothetical protein
MIPDRGEQPQFTVNGSLTFPQAIHRLLTMFFSHVGCNCGAKATFLVTLPAETGAHRGL